MFSGLLLQAKTRESSTSWNVFETIKQVERIFPMKRQLKNIFMTMSGA